MPLIPERPHQEPTYIKTTVLCNNPGLYRDCWAEKDLNGQWFFVIRQLKFNNVGANPEPKIIRLRQDEAWAMCNALQQTLPAE